MSVTVLIPASAREMTTLENVALDLGRDIGTLEDMQIQRFIVQASARAASFCRRSFGRETVRERLAPCPYPDDQGLLLDRGPVVRILGVVADGVTMAAETYETDGMSLYRVEGGARRPWSAHSLVVDYEAGWLLPSEERGIPPTTAALDLPADVERAVVQLVGVALSASGRDVMVKSEDVEGVGRFDYYVQGASAELPHPEAEATLLQYRRLRFG